MKAINFTAPVGAAWAADPIFRQEWTLGIQADNKAKGHTARAVARLNELDVPFTALASADWKAGPFESIGDDDAFTAALLIALEGEMMKTGRTVDTAPVSKADGETLRHVIEECGRRPEPEDKEVWQEHSSDLYSRVAWLRNTLWAIQDPVTWVLFAKGTGSCTSQKRRAAILGAPENAERVAKFAKTDGAKGGPGSKGGLVNNRRAKTGLQIVKDQTNPVDVLRLVSQLWGDEFEALGGPLDAVIDALIAERNEKTAK